MFIDTHVHLRDFRQAYKGETVEHGLEVARDSGVDAVFDMPNTDPAITTEEVLEDRLRLARDADVPEVFYGVHLGLTADPEQVKRVVALARAHREVVGLKLYAGRSVGNLEVTRLEEQQQIYACLAAEGYTGVLAVHAEKEGCMQPLFWDPRKPQTHARARPSLAEIASVKDQLQLAQQTGFTGKLHITHISCSEAVALVVDARSQGVDVSCDACPHHLFYSSVQMHGADGLLWKMNPPLRDNASRRGLLQCLKDGKIDWIATDHAPHTLTEKKEHPYMSGIPGLPWWPLFDRWLESEGFSQAQRERLMFTNAAARFGLDITRSNRPLKDRTTDYAFNPYAALEAGLQRD